MSRPSRDVAILFATRILRLFGYGLVSVVLVLFLSASGIGDARIGLLLSLTLGGDMLISLYLTTHADVLGRRRVLVAGALLIIVAGALFSTTASFPLLVLAAIVGVISPSGNEVGPFLAIEQVALAETVGRAQRTRLFAWYTLAGSFATAAGALAGGYLVAALQRAGYAAVASYRAALFGYTAGGVFLVALFLSLTPAVEAESPRANGALFHLHSGKGIVARLSALFALDSFAGGFVVQSLLAWWFHLRFGADPAALGRLFFGANVLAGLSSLAAVRIAERIGLLRTMVVTHLPSNVLLLLVPLMPTFPLAVGVLLLRFSISQMDVPTRQSYVMAVVPPSERSAASGITGVARTFGAAIAPLAAAPLIAHPSVSSIPFFIAGGLKIVYDLALLRGFRKVEERG